jgi:hypothetical protein
MAKLRDVISREFLIFSKILLASWRGTRFEVVQVLRGVCDQVLSSNKKTVSENVLADRARVRNAIRAIW